MNEDKTSGGGTRLELVQSSASILEQLLVLVKQQELFKEAQAEADKTQQKAKVQIEKLFLYQGSKGYLKTSIKKLKDKNLKTLSISFTD